MVGKLARKPIKRPCDRHAAGKADELSRRMITGSPRRLVDESPGQETTLAASEEFDHRRRALADAGLEFDEMWRPNVRLLVEERKKQKDGGNPPYL
jgi:hypothetical protein